MDTELFDGRLASIEQRLTRIEGQLGLSAMPENEVPVATTEESDANLVPEFRPVAVPPPLPVMPQVESVGHDETHAVGVPEEQDRQLPPAAISYARSAPVRVLPAATTAPVLEQTIGLKWAGWAGAVVLTIGAALGIRFAYDQGWLGRVPPEARLALMSLGGAVLLAAGEIVYRRINRIAAASLYGAGVAVFFLVSYAGHAYYQLYQRDAAFILMALSTLLGAGVALRGGLVSIAVLSLVGGNIAPLLLRADHPRVEPFLAYLLMLQLVALVLCVFGRSSRWWILRGLSLVTTTLWILPVLGSGPDMYLIALFLCLSAALYHGEVILAAARFDTDAGPDEAPARPFHAPTFGAGFTFAGTILLLGGLLVVLRPLAFAGPQRDIAILGLAAAAGLMAWFLRGTTGPALRVHAVGYRVQALAVVIIAVPVILSGVWVVLAWGGLALALALLGAMLAMNGARWAAAATWVFAVLYLAGWTLLISLAPSGGNVWLTVLDTPIPSWACLAWILTLTAHGVGGLGRLDFRAIRVSDDSGPSGGDGVLAYERRGATVAASPLRFQRLASVIAIAGGLLWAAAALAAMPPIGATFMILVYAWITFAGDLSLPRLRLMPHAVAALAIASAKWIVFDTLARRLAPGWSATDSVPFFNVTFALGLLVAGSFAGLYVAHRMRSRRATTTTTQTVAVRPLLFAFVAIVGVLTFALSLEIDCAVERAAIARQLVWGAFQLKQLEWTMLWTLAACALVWFVRRIAPRPQDRPDWVSDPGVLLTLLAVKFLALDALMLRLLEGPAPVLPMLNLQVLAGGVVLAGLLYALLGARGESASRQFGAAAPAGLVAALCAMLIVLWTGTLEIDRVFERWARDGISGAIADPARAKQVVISIFWSLFAIGAVVAGFRFRAAGLRYFGLLLFAGTLLKVVIVDMSQVQTGLRILSFLGMGGLLLGTSVLYGKLSPMLLATATGPSDAGDADRT